MLQLCHSQSFRSDQHAMSPPSSGRRKRVLGKKPGAHPTLVQSGQTVASSGATTSTGPPGNQRDGPKTLDGFMLLERCHGACLERRSTTLNDARRSLAVHLKLSSRTR
jgi:hypothetical protein